MKKIFYALMIFAAFVSCSKDEKSDPSAFKEGQEVTISGSVITIATKAAGVAHEDSSMDIAWRTGDVVTVSVGSASSQFTLSSGAGKTTAEFKGTMPAEGESFDVQFGSKTPADQDYVLGGMDGNAVVAKGAGTLKDGFALTAQNAVLRFDLYGSGSEVGSVVVKTPAGDYTVTCNPKILLSSSEYDTTPFFVAAEPFSAGEVTIEVNDPEGELIGTLAPEKAISLEAGKVFNAGAMELVVIPKHIAVDLGLPSGTKWATTNVGASTPEQFGDYVAWGKTELYYETLVPEIIWKTGYETGYSWTSYVGYELSSFSVAKGHELDPAPYEDPDEEGYRILKDEYDYATVSWGEEWQMPTLQQFVELVDNTTIEVVEAGVASTKLPSYVPAVSGALVFKGKDANLDTSTYIFLPATGDIKGLDMVDPACVYLWSKTLWTAKGNAWASGWFFTIKDGVVTGNNYRSRYFGVPVRPVMK